MDASEIEVAWAEVLARWTDEAAHRAFLDRFADLDGLAEAGRRYKVVLDARPGDEVAARWRDEVVKRATALALAQLPRKKPARQLSPRLRRAVLFALASASMAAAAWAMVRMTRSVGAP